ncbi:hypothetical protein LX36DRAFT_348516 [Colletotrichum falcatum]|nr:hypothetical protein LX36DRAFT_348516 [Colletotrichum falcatum]
MRRQSLGFSPSPKEAWKLPSRTFIANRTPHLFAKSLLILGICLRSGPVDYYSPCFARENSVTPPKRSKSRVEHASWTDIDLNGTYVVRRRERRTSQGIPSCHRTPGEGSADGSCPPLLQCGWALASQKLTQPGLGSIATAQACPASRPGQGAALRQGLMAANASPEADSGQYTPSSPSFPSSRRGHRLLAWHPESLIIKR